MNAIFYLPAHPSYFDDEYTQEEIERSIVVLDRRNGCTILKGNQRTKVKWGFHAVTAFGHNPNFPKTHLR
jgi:hypothetical protein